MKRAHQSIWISVLAILICTTAVAPALGSQATLAWDPDQDTDLEGYGVYYKSGGDGPPYDLFGYVSTAELPDSDAPSFTITGLQQGGTYYFAVTAYDSSGNESAFSESVCAEIGATVTPCLAASSSANAGDSGSSGGGGGGGGCFIHSLYN